MRCVDLLVCLAVLAPFALAASHHEEDRKKRTDNAAFAFLSSKAQDVHMVAIPPIAFISKHVSLLAGFMREPVDKLNAFQWWLIFGVYRIVKRLLMTS